MERSAVPSATQFDRLVERVWFLFLLGFNEFPSIKGLISACNLDGVCGLFSRQIWTV